MLAPVVRSACSASWTPAVVGWSRGPPGRALATPPATGQRAGDRHRDASETEAPGLASGVGRQTKRSSLRESGKGRPHSATPARQLFRGNSPPDLGFVVTSGWLARGSREASRRGGRGFLLQPGPPVGRPAGRVRTPGAWPSSGIRADSRAPGPAPL